VRKILAIGALLACTAAVADQTTRYTIIFSGEARGEQVTTVGADGRIRVDYQYSQNGRGPTLKEEIRVAEDGTFTRYSVTGKSTFGAPVNESFSRRGDRVEWKSHSDQGKKIVSGPATYLPVESSSESDAIIVRALTRQPGGRLAAVPEGELSAQKVATQKLESQGRGVEVALYAVTGVSTQPSWLWLTDDAEQRFFGYVYPGWMHVIETGWEASADTLEARQVAAEQEWLQKLAARLTHRYEDPIVFRNVRVFDSRNARLLDPADVYVQGGRIAALYEVGSTARADVVEIDGNGRVLSPALFDMHTHEGPWNAVLQIAGGVTTSRDMGADNATLAELAAGIDRSEVIGPRIARAGFIEGKSEFSSPGGFAAASLEDAKDAIDWYAQHGYRQIKIYNSFRPEWVEPTAAYAHQRGLRVSGHVPAFMRAEDVVRAGYDEIQHINQVMLNFLVKPTDDTRTLTRFYLMTEHARDIDIDSPQVREFLKLLKERGTTIDNTAAVFEGMFLQRQGQTHPGFVSVAANLPTGLQRSLRTNSMNVNDKNARQYRESWQRVLQFIGRMHEAGIPFVAGTDGMAGFTLHRELELYVQAGLTPAEALQVATWNGAKYTGLLDQLGSIERGKRADLILIDGDPTQDISAIRKISLVMKDGVVFYPAEVYEAVGVKRFVGPPRVTAKKL
jgi:cytosine/adenosine deaminase-related metal-dependent hydrolase